jgi:hypothetical protein
MDNKTIKETMRNAEQTVCDVMEFLESVNMNDLRNQLQNAWDESHLVRDANPDFKFEGWRNS